MKRRVNSLENEIGILDQQLRCELQEKVSIGVILDELTMFGCISYLNQWWVGTTHAEVHVVPSEWFGYVVQSL